MKISVSQAKAHLTDLVRQAEAGKEVILTRHGRAVICLVPVQRNVGAKARKTALDMFRRSVAGKITPGPDAARSQDFLYDEHGLPR